VSTKYDSKFCNPNRNLALLKVKVFGCFKYTNKNKYDQNWITKSKLSISHCNTIVSPCCMQQIGGPPCGLSTGNGQHHLAIHLASFPTATTLKHFNQMTQLKIIYLLHIIYSTRIADSVVSLLHREKCNRGDEVQFLALLNLFTFWRGHEQKTETVASFPVGNCSCCWWTNRF